MDNQKSLEHVFGKLSKEEIGELFKRLDEAFEKQQRKGSDTTHETEGT